MEMVYSFHSGYFNYRGAFEQFLILYSSVYRVEPS